MSRIPQSLRDELRREAGGAPDDIHSMLTSRAATALARLRNYERDNGLDPALVIDPADQLRAPEPHHFPSGASERTLPLGEYVADEVAGAVPLFTVGDPVEFTDGMGATVWGRIKEIDGGSAFVTEAGDRATWGVGLDRLRRIEHASRPLSPDALDRLEAREMGGDGPHPLTPCMMESALATLGPVEAAFNPLLGFWQAKVKRTDTTTRGSDLRGEWGRGGTREAAVADYFRELTAPGVYVAVGVWGQDRGRLYRWDDVLDQFSHLGPCLPETIAADHPGPIHSDPEPTPVGPFPAGVRMAGTGGPEPIEAVEARLRDLGIFGVKPAANPWEYAASVALLGGKIHHAVDDTPPDATRKLDAYCRKLGLYGPAACRHAAIVPNDARVYPTICPACGDLVEAP